MRHKIKVPLLQDGTSVKMHSLACCDTINTYSYLKKEFVCEKQRPYKFIPSHPMAGTENKGYENSFEGLFKGCKWTITPYFGYEGITKLEKIIIALGATPIITTVTPALFLALLIHLKEV